MSRKSDFFDEDALAAEFGTKFWIPLKTRKRPGARKGGVAIYVGIEFGAISRVTILPPHAARSMI
jgi:hypothetical protein